MTTMDVAIWVIVVVVAFVMLLIGGRALKSKLPGGMRPFQPTYRDDDPLKYRDDGE
jgi:hypothetical protein